MRRLLLSLALPLFLASCATPLLRPVTTPEEFRARGKTLYYNPKKEGLKSFQCNVSTRLLDDLLNDVGLGGILERALAKFFLFQYSLTFDTKGIRVHGPRKFDIKGLGLEDLTKDPTTRKGMKRFELFREELRQLIELEVKIWSWFSPPLTEGPSPADIRVMEPRKVPEGWRVSIRAGSDRGELSFDESCRLTRMVAHQAGQRPVTLHTDFEPTSKGLRIRSCAWEYRGVSYRSKVEYRTLDDFFLPSKIETTLTTGGSGPVSLYDVLTFTDHRVDW